jgi:regulator of protease activity HflC (stomatin/prohibitin superfamily)
VSSSPSSAQINIVSVAIVIVVGGAGAAVSAVTRNPVWAVVAIVVGIIASLSPRVARQWERAIVLRLGRFVGLKGPGLFWVVPSSTP